MPKQFIIKLRNYFVKNNELTARKISTYHKTIKFGILIQAKEIKNPTAINTFVSSLKSDGKKVSVLCFCENKSSLYFDFDFDQFNLEDISWSGKILKSSVNLFTEQQFDYLFCLGVNLNNSINSILLQSKTNCRVGLQTTLNEPFLDLMIYSNNIEITPEDIGLEILELVKKIKTND